MHRTANFGESVVALIPASSPCTADETATSAEIPEVHQAINPEPKAEPCEETEDFLEPLVFNWSEDNFIVSQAIRSYMAHFDADH